MPQTNPETVAEIIRDVAQNIIMPRFNNLSEDEVSTKSGPNDLVTIADLESEEELTKQFNALLVGSHVVGEEAVSKGDIDMSLLRTENDPVWVVDPVDGTANFRHGRERFGVIISLNKGGETIQSWIYDIPGDRMAIAEHGSGVEINGHARQYPAMLQPLSESRGFISRKFLPPVIKDQITDTLKTEFGQIDPYLCCAHEYLDILDGHSFYSLYSRIRPWDHLAGAMMLSEAGGHVRKWDGSSYGPGDEKGGLVCAPDEPTWRSIHDKVIAPFI